MFAKGLQVMIFSVLMLSSLLLAAEIRPVKATGTIYISADGSVEGTTHIQTVDNVTYVFTADTIDSIVVEKDNMILDGNGYVLQGTQDISSVGIDLSGRTNVTVRNILIRGFWAGIELGWSSGIIISDNTITSGAHGIYGLYFASGNTICRNNITNNGGFGIAIYGNNNTVYGNNFTNNYAGVTLNVSSGNLIYHNNFVANFHSQVIIWSDEQVSGEQPNTWDSGYPSGGNYWSDHVGPDVYSGPFQNETGFDWISDTPYVINQNNTDRYPLTQPFALETEETQVAYRNLLGKYNAAASNYTKYNALASNYTSLQSLYSQLVSNASALQSSYDTLNASYNELKSKQESTQNTVNRFQYVTYAETTVLMILIIVVAYLAVRKPKIKP